jgi:hypothetical protein
MPTIKGTKFTEEHKRNLSLALKGINKGRKHTPETRKKMSESHKGMKFTKEHKRKMSVSALGNTKWLGKKHKLDWKAKVSGGKNVMWKGDKVGYLALHSWVRRHLGKPNRCDFCGLEEENGNKFEWANKSGNYLRDLTDWLRLCVSCHRLLDKKRRKNVK